MSAHKTVDTDGEITSIYSGAFTADVELMLTFGGGSDITLGGTIDWVPECPGEDNERSTRRGRSSFEKKGVPARQVRSRQNAPWQ